VLDFRSSRSVTQVAGATITWSPVTTISGKSDVSTVGTLDRAFSFARGDTSTGPFGPSTINGVTFMSFPTSNNPHSASMGNTTVTAAGGSNTVESFNGLAGDNYPFSPPVPPFSNLSAAYQLMLSTAVYNDSGSLALTLNGLTPGQKYLFEVWTNDSRSNSTRMEKVTAGNSVRLAYNSTQVNGGLGQFAIGTFTADNSGSQSITFNPIALPAGLPASQINGFQLRAIPTVYTWSTTTTGFALLNATHWTGNPGHYPGVDANINSIADGARNDVAAFSSMAFAATILGINFSGSLSSGLNDNTGASGSLILGAIDYLSTANKSISIGDNSGSAGTLTLTGVTLSGVANTVLANEGSHSLTLAPQVGGGTADMTLALGNATNNVIQVNGSGGINISSAIQNGAGVAGSLTKRGQGTLTLSHANTYTGTTIIAKGTLVVNNTTSSCTGGGQVKVNLGTLAGVGKINGAVTVGTGSSSGAILLGGNSAASAGTLTINNTLTFNSLSTCKCVLNRTTVKASKVSALGVTIKNSVPFTFVDTGSGASPTGTVFTVISNISANPIFGTFSNLPNGSTFTSSGNKFQVSYAGGTGNDLTLKVVP
jgi:autotransporter-associated beta strand protein